jgi:membrane associated rhomboid family serine protease
MELSLTLAIILLTGVVSWLAFSNRRLMERLILWPPAVARGEAWRLASYGLVHADIGHLLFNMITLYFFGSAMERFYAPYLGPAGFLLFYAGALVVAILPAFLRHRKDPGYRTLGASGAVSAVLFAFILLQPWAMIFVFVVPVPAILFALTYVAWSIWAGRQKRDNINHSAHLWGAAYGVLFTVLLEPRVLEHFWRQLLSPLG